MQPSWLSQNHNSVIAELSKTFSTDFKYNPTQDRIDGKYKDVDLYYTGKLHTNRKTFAISLNVDIVGINVMSLLENGEYQSQYAYEMTGTKGPNLIVKSKDVEVYVNLLTNQVSEAEAYDEKPLASTEAKIYDFATGIFDFSLFELKLNQCLPQMEVVVYRGSARRSSNENTKNKFEFPHLSLIPDCAPNL